MSKCTSLPQRCSCSSARSHRNRPSWRFVRRPAGFARFADGSGYAIMGIRFEMRKRFFPTSLALLLVVGSLGHVFAAAFCPHRPGHDCCPTTTAGAQLDTQTQQLMQGMAMHTVANESMPMDSGDMP